MIQKKQMPKDFSLYELLHLQESQDISYKYPLTFWKVDQSQLLMKLHIDLQVYQKDYLRPLDLVVAGVVHDGIRLELY